MRSSVSRSKLNARFTQMDDGTQDQKTDLVIDQRKYAAEINCGNIRSRALLATAPDSLTTTTAATPPLPIFTTRNHTPRLLCLYATTYLYATTWLPDIGCENNEIETLSLKFPTADGTGSTNIHN